MGEIQDLGGLSEAEIDRRDERLEFRVMDKLKDHVDHKIEGLRTYVDQRDEHGKRNWMQDIADARAIFELKLTHMEEVANGRHKENIAMQEKTSNNVDKLNNKVAWATGALIASHLILTYVLPHLWKAL